MIRAWLPECAGSVLELVVVEGIFCVRILKTTLRVLEMLT